MPTLLNNIQALWEGKNEQIIEINHLGLKNFFNLETVAYRDGAPDAKTKDLRGSIVTPQQTHSVDIIDLLWIEDDG